MIRMTAEQALRLIAEGLPLPPGSSILCKNQEQVYDVHAALRASRGDAKVVPEPPLADR